MPLPAPSAAERAFARAAHGLDPPGSAPSWGRFHPAWRGRLRAAFEPIGDATIDAAPLAELAREHAAEARPDPAHVHPSWWVRALQDESPSVRRAVVAGLSDPSMREALRDGLGLTESDLKPDHPPEPGALGAALALWAERIVGGPPHRDDDPAIVAALASLGPRPTARLLKRIGLAKHAMRSHAEVDADPKLGAGDLRHIAAIRHDLPQAPSWLVDRARVDLESQAAADPSRLGLLTVARLLAATEPHRARWALQHLPYNVARYVRAMMPADPEPELVAWETTLLDAARRNFDAGEEEP